MTSPYEYGTPVEDLVKRYRALYSGAVYDVLDELGLPHQALAPDVKPVRADMVLAGPAFTMKGIPDSTGKAELRERRIHMFGDMKATGVPLIDVRDCSFDTQAAHYGEMNATVGQSCGVIGAVVDGGCRDTGFLLRAGFPTFCRYQSPVEAYRRWSYYEWQRPVALRGALSAVVPVSPGDFLFGDLDGVVVVPRDLVVEVLGRTEELVDQENGVRAEFESGADPVAVYQRHGRL
jgi:4-hydroxy-4-methyl-2-oxoglutarate aldolase